MTPQRRASLGATLAVTCAATAAAFMVLAPLAHLLIAPKKLPPPFPEQNQDAETLLFVLVFAVLLPLALILVPRVLDRIASGPNAPALPLLAASSVATLIGAMLFVSVSQHLPWGGGLDVLGVVTVIWWGAAGGILLLVSRDRARPTLLRVAARPGAARAAWAAVGVAIPLGSLAFTALGSVTLVPLLVGLLAIGGVALLPRRSGPLPRLRRPWGAAVDGAVVVLLLLAVPNVVIFDLGDPAHRLEATILQFHQNFFLGPANHVLGGGAMLVDTLSQYGVGSILFLVGWFHIAPIGNGMLGLLEGILSAALFATAYLILRAAGVSRLIAGCAMTVAVVVLVYGLQYPLGGLLQHGALRFGLPAGVIVGAVLEARLPHRAVAARALTLSVVAISSIWALEAFAYTLITVAAIAGFAVATGSPDGRRRRLGGWVAGVAGACLIAHATFAGITLAATGQLPEWGRYLATLHAFLVGGVGDLTFDFSPWSAGLGVGALYVASAAAIVLVVRRRPDVALRERTTLMALTGCTAYGVALFSYFVNRSADDILAYVSLPAVLTGALWLSLVLRPATGASASLRRVGPLVASVVGVLLVAVAWSGAGDKFSQSALAHAVPGGTSLGNAIDRLWDRPAIAVGAKEGQRLLDRYMAGQGESVVLTSADLSVEVLIRTGRINEIPLSDPWEDSLVPEQHLDDLSQAVRALSSGDRVLLDGPAAGVFRGYLQEPDRDPLVDPFSQSTLVPSGIAILQEWALKQIGLRFRLKPVARGADGLVVAELVGRQPGATR